MNHKLILLLAGTGLVAGLTGAFAAPLLQSARMDLQSNAARIFLIDSDNNEGGEQGYRGGEDDDDCGDDDEGQSQGCMAPVAPGGAPIAPPDNGLFQNGSKPAVTVN